MQTAAMTVQPSSIQSEGLYAELMSHATGLPNDELFAQMICSHETEAVALSPNLGLSGRGFAELMARHFPGVRLGLSSCEPHDDPRTPERDDVLRLLLAHRAFADISERWMAEIVTSACMANDHLWQDLGLRSRKYLSQLMTQNFPALAAKNVKDMKWKKFIYKQLCEQEGIYVCRSPSCAVCADYANCFGPEE